MRIARDELEALENLALKGELKNIDTMFFILGLTIAKALIEISENINATLHKSHTANSSTDSSQA